jgi:hypothetical protein
MRETKDGKSDSEKQSESKLFEPPLWKQRRTHVCEAIQSTFIDGQSDSSAVSGFIDVSSVLDIG